MICVDQSGKGQKKTSIFYQTELDCVLLDFAFSVVQVLYLRYLLNLNEGGRVNYVFKFYFSLVEYLEEAGCRKVSRVI